jgi:hypothetical protein
MCYVGVSVVKLKANIGELDERLFDNISGKGQLRIYRSTFDGYETAISVQ